MDGWPGPAQVWGKFVEPEKGGPRWHPLADHCTDVACVLEALVGQPTIRRRLARASGLDDLDAAQVSRLCFFAFLHDIGKCALGFRAKAVPELGGSAGHLAALRPLVDGPLTGEFAAVLDLPQLRRWAGDALGAYLLIVFAHHGRTPKLRYDGGSDVGLLRGWTGRQGEPLRRLGELADTGRSLFGDAFASDAGHYRALRPSSICSPAS